jgi:uncharacterized damage-inducible protein DinB
MTDREFFARLCSTEHARFVGVLQATPAGSLDYRPHPRSRSASELIGHLIGHELDLQELVESGTINHRINVPFTDVNDAVGIYRKAHEALKPTLQSLDDAAWNAAGKFLVGDKVIIEAPRRDLAWMLLLDAVHHRGQLSTYLRPMGGTVPSIYGPSADTVAATA